MTIRGALESRQDATALKRSWVIDLMLPENLRSHVMSKNTG